MDCDAHLPHILRGTSAHARVDAPGGSSASPARSWRRLGRQGAPLWAGGTPVMHRHDAAPPPSSRDHGQPSGGRAGARDPSGLQNLPHSWLRLLNLRKGDEPLGQTPRSWSKAGFGWVGVSSLPFSASLPNPARHLISWLVPVPTAICLGKRSKAGAELSRAPGWSPLSAPKGSWQQALLR